MNADHPDYPLYVLDRQWWKYLDVLGGAERKEVPNAAAVYDRLLQYALAGDIAWDYVLQADSLDKAKRGLALLFERMAGELTTSDQLQGLLTSMNSAAKQKGATIKFREATGSAGQILENRALGRHGERPLPTERLARRPHVSRPHLVPHWGQLLGAKNPRRGATRIGPWPDPLGGSGAPRWATHSSGATRAPCTDSAPSAPPTLERQCFSRLPGRRRSGSEVGTEADR